MTDIEITKHVLRDKRNICGVSPIGIAWIMKNLDNKLKAVVTIDAEHVDEMKSKMEAAGLTVGEWKVG